MTKERRYQVELDNAVHAQWDEGRRGVLMQLATGGGKTVIIGSVARKHAASPWNPRLPAGCAMAHRGELVSQVSQAYAREGIQHGIIAAQSTIRNIVNNHMDEFGRTFYNARAPWRVASVDTIIRDTKLTQWAATIGMVIVDEAHHVLRANKWGRAIDMFPKEARILLPTATPDRADGKGLGSHADGFADVMVQGPSMRWLINAGYLTDYRIFSIPASDLNLDGVQISAATGDFNKHQLSETVKKSRAIVGDIVDTYVKHARGKLGVTFAVDIEHGEQITEAFNRAGVPAILLTGDTPDAERIRALKAFKRREYWQLVNVDLFGEGFDLPAIECVSFGRPTDSFALYSQMFGRALRLMISALLMGMWDTFTDAQRRGFIAQSDKPVAMIFDHVGNVLRHMGPPDKERGWSLDARSKRARKADDAIPYRTCLQCASPYERIHPACPYCGAEPPPPADRSAPNLVDGDIFEYSPELLAMLRGDIAKVDAAPTFYTGENAYFMRQGHVNRQIQQKYLRDHIALWAGSHAEHSDRVNYRRFFHRFGVDVMTAMSLSTSEARDLRKKIADDLERRAIINNILVPEEHN